MARVLLVGAVCSDFGTWVASDLQKGLLLGRSREKVQLFKLLDKSQEEVACSHMTRMRTGMLYLYQLVFRYLPRERGHFFLNG